MVTYAPDFLLDRLLYRDGLMLIIDKPAGLPVHAGPSGGDNLENYFDALRFGLPRQPALAHRLDRTPPRDQARVHLRLSKLFCRRSPHSVQASPSATSMPTKTDLPTARPTSFQIKENPAVRAAKIQFRACCTACQNCTTRCKAHRSMTVTEKFFSAKSVKRPSRSMPSMPEYAEYVFKPSALLN